MELFNAELLDQKLIILKKFRSKIYQFLVLPGAEDLPQEESDRPNYDFEFKLPDPSKNSSCGWPLLLIEDKP